MEFGSPVCAASILTLDVGFDGVLLEAFNAANALVDSQSITNGPDVGVGEFDTLFVSGPGIDRLEISQLNPADTGDGYHIDDLRFRHICDVGGEFLGVDSTALLVSGAQMNAAWMIPVIVSGIGFAIVIARKF